MSWADFNHDAQCPACGVVMDGTVNTQGLEPPEPEDRAVCAYCQTVCVYTDELKLRLPTEDEQLEHASNPHLQAIISAMRRLGPPPSRR